MSIRVEPLFAWYDLWIGLYIDIENQAAYFFPVPTLGVRISWNHQRGNKLC